MRWIYSVFIFVYRTAVWVMALFSEKARKMMVGRRTVPAPTTGVVVWVHCASLGEFEQGRPLIETLKKARPEIYLVLTFFSPSGYEIRKNYPLANQVLYMPWDTPALARHFIMTLRPALAIFIKYEFWIHHLIELHRNHIPVISVSAIFRPEQLFFRRGGSLFREVLGQFHRIYVQNPESLKLLHSIGITRTILAGDTRFDRVHAQATHPVEVPGIDGFKGQHQVLVCGSLWPEDFRVLKPWLMQTNLKVIIAPHELDPGFMEEIEQLPAVARYSVGEAQFRDARLLIIDNIGMLAALYRYGEVAYVGGAFGAGLHNILEAACYGKPVLFGNRKFQKFREATQLVERGGAFPVASTQELSDVLNKLSDHSFYEQTSAITKKYVQENLGATQLIAEDCLALLSNSKQNS